MRDSADSDAAAEALAQKIERTAGDLYLFLNDLGVCEQRDATLAGELAL